MLLASYVLVVILSFSSLFFIDGVVFGFLIFSLAIIGLFVWNVWAGEAWAGGRLIERQERKGLFFSLRRRILLLESIFLLFLLRRRHGSVSPDLWVPRITPFLSFHPVFIACR
jgi:hypothetical protein